MLGAFLLQPLSEVVNNYFGTQVGTRLLVFGGLLALVVLIMPSGIIPAVRTAVRRWRERGSTVPFIEQPVRLATPAATPAEPAAAPSPSAEESPIPAPAPAVKVSEPGGGPPEKRRPRAPGSCSTWSGSAPSATAPPGRSPSASRSWWSWPRC